MLSLPLPFSSFAQSTHCSSNKFDRYGHVSKVYDGDTIKLTDGTRVRLIGINTPEMNYRKGTPEPYAKKARNYLKRKVLNQKIGLKLGTEQSDKYNRMLAHVFLEDGTNIQHSLLANGLASNIAIPPNLWRQWCYNAAEQAARKAHKGIWKHHYFAPVAASHLNKNKTGYRRISGEIKSIEQTDGRTDIVFKNKLTLQIHKKNRSYFKHFNVEKLLNKNVIVSGWVRTKNRRFIMSLKHPSAIETL